MHHKLDCFRPTGYFFPFLNAFVITDEKLLTTRIWFSEQVIWKWKEGKRCESLQRLSVTHALQRFKTFQKLRFGGLQSNVSMTITASGVSRNTISMSCINQFSEYASCSFIFTLLVDKKKLRSKTYKIVWSAFSFVSLTGNVLKLQIYKQCTTTATWDTTKYK